MDVISLQATASKVGGLSIKQIDTRDTLSTQLIGEDKRCSRDLRL